MAASQTKIVTSILIKSRTVSLYSLLPVDAAASLFFRLELPVGPCSQPHENRPGRPMIRLPLCYISTQLPQSSAGSRKPGNGTPAPCHQPNLQPAGFLHPPPIPLLLPARIEHIHFAGLRYGPDPQTMPGFERYKGRLQLPCSGTLPFLRSHFAKPCNRLAITINRHIYVFFGAVPADTESNRALRQVIIESQCTEHIR